MTHLISRNATAGMARVHGRPAAAAASPLPMLGRMLVFPLAVMLIVACVSLRTGASLPIEPDAFVAWLKAPAITVVSEPTRLPAANAG